MKNTSVNVLRLWVVTLTVFLFLCTNAIALSTPSLLTQFGTTKTDTAYAVASDIDGNVYVAGDTLGTPFDGQISNGGSQDGFLRKMDSTGKLLWTVLIGTPAYDEIRGLVLDSSGNAYVCGTTLTASRSYEMFIAKVSPSGTILWFNEDGTPQEDYAESLTIDPDGNIYMCGWSAGSIDGVTITKNYRDAVVAKYTSSGSRVWVKQFNNSVRYLDDFAYGITYYSNRLYVTGLTRCSEKGNLFLYVYDLDGNMIFNRAIGGENTAGRGIAVNASGIYITGGTISDFDGHPLVGGIDAVIIKYDLNGNKLWSSLWGASPSSSWEYASAIVVDSDNNAYVAGYTNGTLDGQKSTGGYDIFIKKFDANGNVLYTNQFGGASTDNCNAIALSPSENILLAGSTYNNTFTKQASVPGGYDAFVSVYPTESSASFVDMTVQDQTTTMALSSVLVTFSDSANNAIAATSTDTNGKAYIKTKGQAKILDIKAKDGFTSLVDPETLNLVKGNNKFTSYMVPCTKGFQATVQVIDILTNKVVPSAAVSVTDVNKGFVGTYTTDINGTATFTLKYAGETSLSILKNGYASLTEVDVFNTGSKSSVTVYVTPVWSIGAKVNATGTWQSQVFTLPVDCSAYWFLTTLTKNNGDVAIQFMQPDKQGYALDMFSNTFTCSAYGIAGNYSTNCNFSNNVILKANTRYFIWTSVPLSITDWTKCTATK